MDPAVYDAWYENPRGAWVGATELRIVESELCLRAGARVLDVGCGSGWFTRHLARRTGIDVTGIDIDARSLNYARQRDACSRYVQADALAGLPVANLRTRSAVFVPSGSVLARLAERCVPAALPYGALLLVSGEKSPVP